MSASLLQSAQNLLAGLISLGRTRFELFSVELREELARLTAALLGGLAVLVLAALGLAFGAVALVLAVGEEHRLMTVCAIAAAFIAAAAILAWRLRRLTTLKPRAFDSTLAELARDYEAIKP
jgi:uncharacterized membrane protein YqjE